MPVSSNSTRKPTSLAGLTSSQLRHLRRKLLAWFKAEKRALPWRETKDPYRIWISEVMLQQTRVAAVLPYYRKFLARFPNVKALAAAPESGVLRHWAGLGYYSRARNLRRAAQQMVRRHAGRFPRSREAALELPGVGQYTAAAILSIAYGEALAVLDGNVARVLARLLALRGEVRQPARWKQLAETAQILLEARAPGDWNQAMMELGATVCTPQAPDCGACPAAKFCRARALGIQDQIPPPRKKRATEDVCLAAAVLLDERGRTVLVRPASGSGDGLFSRMWQFPAVRAGASPDRKLRRHLRDRHGIEADRLIALPTARHTVTYRRVTLLPYLMPVERLPRAKARPPRGGDAGSGGVAIEHVALSAVERRPTSSATRKIARRALAAIKVQARNSETQRAVIAPDMAGRAGASQAKTAC